MKGFAPSLTMTLCFGLAILILLILGTFAVMQRNTAKAMTAHYKANINEPVTDWSDFHPLWKIGANRHAEFRRVRVTGILLPHLELFQTGYSATGKLGLNLWTPMRLESGSVIFIDRGWVEADYPMNRSVPFFIDPMTIEGVFRIARKPTGFRSRFFPKDNPIEAKTSGALSMTFDQWQTLDLPAMAEHTGLDSISIAPSFYITQIREADSLPDVHIQNSHLEYAITWFGLALILLGAYIALGIKRAQGLSLW